MRARSLKRRRQTGTTTEVATVADSLDSQLRAAMFAHLDGLLAASSDGTLRSETINAFSFDGRSLRNLSSRLRHVHFMRSARAPLTPAC